MGASNVLLDRLGGCVLAEGIAHLLGAVVGDFDTDVRLICREGLSESFLLTLREPITRGVQKKPDLVEGITLASAVTQGVLLDATAYFIKGVTGELDDMEGIEHAGCVLVAGQAMAFLLSLEGIQRRDSHPRTEVFAALGQPVLVHGARPAWDQVQQPCRGVILPACQVYDAGELTGAPAASVLVMPHASRQPPAPAPPRNGRGHQMRLAGTA